MKRRTFLRCAMAGALSVTAGWSDSEETMAEGVRALR